MPSTLLSAKPIGLSEKATIKDCLDLPAFNAMYQADPTTSSAKFCKDPTLGTAFIKQVVHDFIRVGGKKIDINDFVNQFGYTPIPVDTKEIYNRYVTDPDFNVYFEQSVEASGVDVPFDVQVLKACHSGNGKFSYPEEGMIVVDKENSIMYSIEAKDTTNDYAHKLTIRPLRSDVKGSVKKNKKYLILPSRLVGDYSCPKDMNEVVGMGYVQKVNAFRIRRDWCVKIGLLRGYRDKLRFVIMWDNEGNKITAWDTYEAQKAREALMLSLNTLAFLATPITSSSIINGTGTTVVDDLHTGFYGLKPSIQYGGGNVADFDASVGLDLDSDIEPLILMQDSLKTTMYFMVKHGLGWYSSFNNSIRNKVKVFNTTFDIPVYNRTGEGLTRVEYKQYEYLGFKLALSLWGALSDTRLYGSQYFSNFAIFVAMDGIVDGNTGENMPPIEFYQYGNGAYTGDYYETQNDKREITRCEAIEGYAAQSVMMATHAPDKHIISHDPTLA